MTKQEQAKIGRIVQTMAKSFTKRYKNSPYSLDDFVQEGWVAALEASATHKRKKKTTPLAGYVGRAIHNRLTNCVSRAILVMKYPHNLEHTYLKPENRPVPLYWHAAPAHHDGSPRTTHSGPSGVIRAFHADGTLLVGKHESILIQKGALLVERLDSLHGKQRTRPLAKLQAVCNRLDESKE